MNLQVVPWSRVHSGASAYRVAALVCMLLLTQGLAGFGAAQPSLLILNSYHAGMDWCDRLTRGAVDTLDQAFPRLEPRIEYMDWKRTPSPEAMRILYDRLEFVCRHRPVDVVIANDNAALDFVLQHRAKLFPKASLVYAGINGYDRIAASLPSWSTGVAEQFSYGDAIASALRLRPDTHRIHIITEPTESGQETREEIKRIMAQWPGIEAVYIPGTDYTKMLEMLRTVPADDVVFLTYYASDAKGRYVGWRQAGHDISAASPAPVFTAYGDLVGTGVVGGAVIHAYDMGRQAGEMAVRLLRGDAVQSVRPVTRLTLRHVYDHRALTRHQLHLAQLPPNAQVLHVSSSLVQQHGRVIAVALTVCLVLLVVIATLIVQIRRSRRAEDALRQESELFRAIFEQSDTGIFVADPQTTMITSANAALCRMLGFSEQELRLSKLRHLLHNDNQIPDDAFIRHAANPDSDELMRLRFIRKDGEQIWTNLSVSIIRNAAGAPTHLLGIMHDVTGQVENDKILRLESLGLMAGGVAHDFNNLLMPILGYSELASLKYPNQPELLHMIGEITTAARRAARLCNDLLDYTGHSHVQMTQINLNAAVSQALDRLRNNDVSDRVIIREDLESALPAVTGDLGQLTRVVLNLLTNACEATSLDNPNVYVRTFITNDKDPAPDQLPEGVYCAVEVMDSGEGIDPELQERIFEPFYTTKFTGRGLGLPAAIGIARMHHGTITVESCPGSGATFRLYIPISTP